jgi:hypothetical protein
LIRVPLLLITYGYSGTGKSTLAAALASARSFKVISSDKVRRRLAGAAAGRSTRLGRKKTLYTRAFTRRTYREVMRQAQVALRLGRSVILDATFLRREMRREAARTARRAGADFLLIECRAADRVVRKRLEERIRSGGSVSDADVGVYLAQRLAAQAPTEIPRQQQIRINTSAPLTQSAARALAAIAKRASGGS